MFKTLVAAKYAINAEEDFPFNVPHWTVSVSFPKADKSKKLEDDLEKLAASRGGSPGQSMTDATVVAYNFHFEEGDANTDGFVKLVKAKYPKATVEFDESDVTHPSED